MHMLIKHTFPVPTAFLHYLLVARWVIQKQVLWVMKPTKIYYAKNIAWIINKQGVQWRFIYTHNTIECFKLKGRMNYKMQKGSFSISIAFSAVITATKQLLEEVKAIHIWSYLRDQIVAHDLWAYSYLG